VQVAAGGQFQVQGQGCEGAAVPAEEVVNWHNPAHPLGQDCGQVSPVTEGKVGGTFDAGRTSHSAILVGRARWVKSKRDVSDAVDSISAVSYYEMNIVNYVDSRESHAPCGGERRAVEEVRKQ
jgi:hypothetical protein